MLADQKLLDGGTSTKDVVSRTNVVIEVILQAQADRKFRRKFGEHS
jgi:hypothetical protein